MGDRRLRSIFRLERTRTTSIQLRLKASIFLVFAACAALLAGLFQPVAAQSHLADIGEVAVDGQTTAAGSNPADRSVSVEPSLDRRLLLSAALGGLAALVGALWWGANRRRKAAELGREIQRVQERKLESLSTLAGGVAHDFNNLLVGIFGYAELARLEAPEGSPVALYLDRIEESAGRAAELSRQMLFYSGRGSFTMAPVALSDLVREVAREIGPTFKGSVTILLELERHLPPVEGDAAQLKQMVRNLILNAAEALAGAPGIVVLSTGFMKVKKSGGAARRSRADSLDPGSYVFLTIDDTGAGMGNEDIERIFDPFFSTKGPGRGLGLAVVQGIVRGHQGHLKVSSTLGRGSTFRVIFPAAERLKGEGQTDGGDDVAEWRGTGTVLVVDDEPTVSSVAERYLQKLGYDVVIASSGESGLEVFADRSSSIAWVLLDISLPGIDGIETARRMREIRPDVRIVLSSGFSKEEALKGQDNPTHGFIEKPYRLRDLEKALRRALEPASDP